MQCQGLCSPLTHTHNLVRVNLNVRCLTALLATQRGLVNQHASVRQCQTLAGSTGSQQNRRSGCRLAQAHGLDFGADELHGVVDGGHCGEGAAG